MLKISKKLLTVFLSLAPIFYSAASFAGEGSVRLNQVTRKSGGKLYRVFVANDLSLSRVAIDVLSAKAKIHHASIVTESMVRIPLQRFKNTALIPAGRSLSESINRNDGVLVIEIQAESFGAFADLRVRASSDVGTPILTTVNSAPSPRPEPIEPPPYRPPTPQPTPYPTPYPTPIPTPTPPEVVYLSYPFSNHGNSKIVCAAQDKGWEEHRAHATCGECLARHGKCVETCVAKDAVVYGKGRDTYGRIAMFEGRGADTYDARRDLERVCDYYRLSRCESDSSRSDSVHSEVISRRSCQ